MTGMVGRTYRLAGRRVKVIARWRDGGLPPDQRAYGCDGCGRVHAPGRTFVGGCDCGMGQACYATWGPVVLAGTVDERNSWHVPAGQLVWWRERMRAPRNVLLEDVETGERIVRPFRGLRRLETT